LGTVPGNKGNEESVEDEEGKAISKKKA